MLAVEDMSLQQVLNKEMDIKAGETLVDAVRDGDFITTIFPHEQVTMKCGDKRVTASATEAIYDWEGQQTAMAYLKKRISYPKTSSIISTGKALVK